MHKENIKRIIIENYSLINYIMVFAFILICLFTEKEFRYIFGVVFLIMTVPLQRFKILNDIANWDEISWIHIFGLFFRLLLVCTLLLMLYFLIPELPKF